MRGVNRPVPKGYPGHPNDACAVTEKLHALTTPERAMIQTFPASTTVFTIFATYWARLTGTAFPIICSISVLLPIHLKSAGNV